MKKASATPFRKSVLARSLAFAMALPLAATAFAQEADTDADEASTDEAATLETISVVGSRIKRANIEGPSPVTVISAEEIEKSGFNTVHDVLQTVAQNVGFGQNDFNAAGGFTPNAGVVNLRGLGPGRTLLLINGRRANDYPFPYNGRSNFQNFNNIPSAAVERIEILAGGASAIYGSDAVAGVVNVVLRRNFEGDAFSVKGQSSSRGGASTMNFQWVGGKTGENGSITYALEYFDRSPLFAWQRDFMDSAADNPFPAGAPGNTGVGGYQPPIGIQIRRQSATGGTLGYVQPAGYDCSASEYYRPHNYTSAVNGAALGPGCGYDRFPAEQTVVNGTKDSSGYIIGDYQFSDTLSGWASLMAFASKGELGGGVEQWQGGPQPGGAHWDPQFNARIFPIRALTPETYGGSQGTFQKFDELSWEFAAGLQGSFGERFDWDFTASTSKYETDRTRPRLTVQGATDFFLGPRLGTVGQGAYAGVAPAAFNGLPVYALNLDRFYGSLNAADYRSMATQVEYEAESQNQLLQFAVTGDLFEMSGGTAAFAAVAEFGSQEYTLNSDPRIAPDVRAIYNLTGTGGGGERDRYALGMEASFPILDSVTLTAAGRYDKYDDVTEVDDAVTWNAGLEWRPFENLLVRGQYATSFKAPDMHYVFSDRSGAFGGVTDFTLCRQNNISTIGTTCANAGGNYNYQAFTTSQGSTTLEEEEGKSWSAGVVWDISDSLSLSADYYEIELEGEVQVIAGGTIINDEYGCAYGTYPNGTPFPYAAGSTYCNEIAGRITRDPANGNRLTEIRSGPTNLSYRKVTGIDASLRYAWDTDRWGDFSARLQWAHTLKHVTRLRADSPLVNYRDANSTADFRSRTTLQLGWSKGDWDASAYIYNSGSFPVWTPGSTLVTSGQLDSRIDGQTLANISIGRRWTENFAMRLNVNNILDDIAPRDPTFSTYPYFWQGYDPVGREVGLQFDFQF